LLVAELSSVSNQLQRIGYLSCPTRQKSACRINKTYSNQSGIKERHANEDNQLYEKRTTMPINKKLMLWQRSLENLDQLLFLHVNWGRVQRPPWNIASNILFLNIPWNDSAIYYSDH